MLQEKRLLKQIQYIREKKQVTYGEVAEICGISEGTVRRDLNELEKRDVVKMVRGGAVWAKSDIARGKPNTRFMMNREEKQDLVSKLDSVIENGYALSINGGTTSIEAAKFIVMNYSNMTIITNSIDINEIVKEKEDFNLIITGGLYDSSENTFVGKQASSDMAVYNTDVALISVSGVSEKKGVTDFRVEEIGIIKAMMKNTKRAVIIADNSKFDKIDCVNVCPLGAIDLIVTDQNLPDEVLNRYKKAGVDIIR